MSSTIWVYFYQCSRSLISLPPSVHVYDLKNIFNLSNNTCSFKVFHNENGGGEYLISQYCPVLPFLGVLPSPGNPGFPTWVFPGGQYFANLVQYLSAWYISHATGSKMYFRSAFHEICCTCFGHLVSHTCKSKISWKSCSLYFLASLSDQFCGNKVLFPLFWTKLWAPVRSQRPSLSPPPHPQRIFRMQNQNYQNCGT